MKLTLLSRAYCHLCDEMLAAVQPIARAHGATVEVIDVDAPANAALEGLWGDRVPALFAELKKLFESNAAPDESKD